ncbi:MAG: LamG domain-containing protein [Verrucomicrobiota bacterium]
MALNYRQNASWIYPTSISHSDHCGIIGIGVSSGSYYYGLGLDISNAVLYMVQYPTYTKTSGSVTANKWQHVAVVRAGGNLYTFLGGINVNTTACGAGWAPTANLAPIGYDPAYGASFDGYIDEVRFSQGARYTSNFTPPSGPLTQ